MMQTGFTAHGFTNGRFTITNLLQFDADISECIAAEHPYDFVMFDFCKAFDKAPHQYVTGAAANFDLNSKAIKWIRSFLTGRTQQERMDDVLSITSNVISGIIQRSVFGPIFYIMLTNSLLSSMLLLIEGFANDLKFVANLDQPLNEGRSTVRNK